MINCAHPTHFEAVLADGGGWRERIRGLRANASRLSHAELDEATELDSGDPHELGSDYRRLLARRSEEHTSELQSLMRISYAVFCLKKKRKNTQYHSRQNAD